MKRKFWNWAKDDEKSRTLTIDGAIADESWFDDDISPADFKKELNAGSGAVTLWINSPGGDVFAAAQIYNMLKEYKGDITVKIDSMAASAASVIAMAGDTVEISPVGLFMIHNPSTCAFGDETEMEKAKAMLAEVKESIINAYMIKTGLDHDKISELMDAETWMNAKKAVELGFADSVMEEPDKEEPDDKKDKEGCGDAFLFSEKIINHKYLQQVADEKATATVDELRARLDRIIH